MQLLKYSTTKIGTDKKILKEYDCILTVEGYRKYQKCTYLNKKGVSIYCELKLPHGWYDMSDKEHQKYCCENDFDVVLRGMYFNNHSTELNVAILNELIEFTEVEDLIIHNTKLSMQQLKPIQCFTNLTSFLLRGEQFGDDFVQVIAHFQKLRMIDVFDTSITNANLLKNVLPNECVIYGP